MVVFNRKDQLQHRFLRTLTRRQIDPPVHYVPSVWGLGEVIRLGLGWGMVPEQLQTLTTSVKAAAAAALR